jgi:hypothetical protein
METGLTTALEVMGNLLSYRHAGGTVVVKWINGWMGELKDSRRSRAVSMTDLSLDKFVGFNFAVDVYIFSFVELYL